MIVLIWLHLTSATLIFHAPLDSQDGLTNCIAPNSVQCTVHGSPPPQMQLSPSGAWAARFENEPGASKRQHIEVKNINWQRIVESGELSLSVWLRPGVRSFAQDSRIVSAQESDANDNPFYRVQLSLDDRSAIRSFSLPTASVRGRVQYAAMETAFYVREWQNPVLPGECLASRFHFISRFRSQIAGFSSR